MSYQEKRSIVECDQNRNLMTNFKRGDTWLYEAAVKEYGREDVFITNDAYWMDGTLDESRCALRCKDVNGDYSDFWKAFEKVAKRMIK